MFRKTPTPAVAALLAFALPLTLRAQSAPDSLARTTGGSSASVPLPAPAKPAPQRPSTFGTSQVSYIEVPAAAFFPSNSVTGYSSDNFGHGPRWATNSTDELVAPIHLPSGAKIVYLELDCDDSSATAATLGSLYVCNYKATGCVQHPAVGVGPADCFLNGYICSGFVNAGGAGLVFSADLTADNITVDNFLNSYTLDVIPQAFDGSEKVDGMIVGYVLQVSPAPATATFSDVPVTNPQFRFVEALVAAGITAGCGGGNYCPNQAVTRGQMAVFLAAALGLQFN